jgi:hypothetical protein
MQRHISVSLALILGLATALSATPLMAMQEGRDEEERQQCRDREPEVQEEFRFDLDCESFFFEGLEVTSTPEVTPATGGAAPDRLYNFRFTGVQGVAGEEDYFTGAYIPERNSPEAMVVEVVAGNFAFRAQKSPGVIVVAQGPELETYTANIPIGLGENPNDRAQGREFREEGAPFDCVQNLPDGRVICLLDTEDIDRFEEGEIFVRLEPGDTVYLPDNSMCFLCNTERIDPNAPAELLIWSSTTGFTGALEFATNSVSSPQSDSTATMQGSSGIVGWMFNPGGRCN